MKRANADNRSGVGLILVERQRQIDAEGYSAKHDDSHSDGSLARAGACYARHAGCRGLSCGRGNIAPDEWPWDTDAWKPGSPIRNLVRAGALIAAEIDRRLRRGETV